MAQPPTQKKRWSEANDNLAVETGRESWAAWILEIEEKKGYEICGARRRDQSPCTKAMVVDNRGGRCRHHGGYSPVGELSHRYKDGRTSKYDISGKLARAYERAQESVQNVLDLEPDIRLLDARMIELIDRLDRGGIDAGELLKLLREHRHGITTFVSDEHQQRLLADIDDMEEVVHDYARDQDTWKEWAKAVQQKKDLIATEDTRRSREHGPMFWTDMLFIIEKIKNIVLTHTERDQQLKIMREFERLMPQQKLLEGGE